MTEVLPDRSRSGVATSPIPTPPTVQGTNGRATPTAGRASTPRTTDTGACVLRHPAPRATTATPDTPERATASSTRPQTHARNPHSARATASSTTTTKHTATDGWPPQVGTHPRTHTHTRHRTALGHRQVHRAATQDHGTRSGVPSTSRRTRHRTTGRSSQGLRPRPYTTVRGSHGRGARGTPSHTPCGTGAATSPTTPGTWHTPTDAPSCRRGATPNRIPHRTPSPTAPSDYPE